jgi:serine/threonine protein kinase
MVVEVHTWSPDWKCVRRVLTLELPQLLDDGDIELATYISGVLVLAKDVATVMAAVHDGGVTHRDLSLGNLFMTDGFSRKIKLGDFGLAVRASTELVNEVGTLQYVHLLDGFGFFCSKCGRERIICNLNAS